MKASTRPTVGVQPARARVAEPRVHLDVEVEQVESQQRLRALPIYPREGATVQPAAHRRLVPRHLGQVQAVAVALGSVGDAATRRLDAVRWNMARSARICRYSVHLFYFFVYVFLSFFLINCICLFYVFLYFL